MQLTQKEKELLKDLKGQEKLCVEKYSQHAAAAKDEQLSQLLTYLGGIEQGHLDTVDDLRRRGVHYEFHEGPWGHEWQFWRLQLHDFAQRIFK